MIWSPKSAAAAVVERLRSDEIDSITSEVAAGRRHNALKGLDERGRAQELVRQQYTGRYPFELLQNANDAAAEPEARGSRVRFELTEQALVVADQGVGFDEAKVRAICTLGRSSKDPRKAVGYKGLGFKSVGQITSSPQIISVDVGFTFDEVRARAAVGEAAGEVLDDDQRLPVYAFPFPLRSEDLGDDTELIDSLFAEGFRSMIRLPLKPGVDRLQVEEHLRDNLSPRLLLLLDAVAELQVRTADWSMTATIVRQGRGDHQEVLLESDQQDEHWLVFKRDAPIPDPGLVAKLEAAWREVTRVGVAVGVLLGEDERPVRSEPRPLHVYFPTEETTGTALLLHGDFVLELDRRHIAASPEALPFNHWLVSQLAELTADAARRLAERFPDEGCVINALAPLSPPHGFGNEVWNAVVDALSGCRFVPTLDGLLVTPPEAAVLPEAIGGHPDAYGFLQTDELPGLVASAVDEFEDGRSFLTEKLGAEALSGEQVAEALAIPGPEREKPFYGFLLDWAEAAGEKAVGGLLAQTCCVRDRAGEWILPGNAFFPRRSDELPFPEGLGISVIEIPELVGLRPLLEHAGVNPFEWRQILATHVLPPLSNPETSSEHRQAALSTLRAYYEAERAGDERTRERIGGVLLPAVTAAGDDRSLRRADQTYFPKAWLGDDRLERIYGAFKVSEFLALPCPEGEDEAQEERAFLTWLGVAQGPRVDRRTTHTRDVYMTSNLYRHPHGSAGDDWWRWQQSTPFKRALDCGQNHPQSQQLRSSATIDRLREVVEAGTTSRLVALWDTLADLWPEYQPALWAELHCQNTSHSGSSRTRRLPSLMAMLLRELEWVPAIVAGQPTMRVPSAVWRLSPDTPRRIRERVAHLPPRPDAPPAHAMCADLAVVDAARPDADQLVQLLRQLEQELNESGDGSAEGLREAARWAMRALDDALDEAADLPHGEIPLLARVDGGIGFHASPVIVQDPLLEEAFGSVLPILDGDRDLRKLHRMLRLRRLDDEVTQRPIAREPLEAERGPIEAMIEAAKPSLAALAVAAVPSREDQVFRGLSRLEIIVCRELDIEYALEGEKRHLSDPVSHIAVRQVREGSARRNLGTAYLELSDDGAPPWFSFGLQLAQYLDVPGQGDAFSLVLSSTPEARRTFLEARKITDDQVEQARDRFATRSVEDPMLGLESWPEIEVAVESAMDSPPTRPQPAPAAQGVPAFLEAPPELEIDALVVREAPAQAVPLERPTFTPGRSDVASSRQVDHIEKNRRQHEVGRRGEEAVFHAERRAVAERGLDPDLVVWHSSVNPEAPYDIESIDPDGQRIWIEVKSTSSTDPEEPFYISVAEILFAAAHGGRYYIYRVTQLDNPRPPILRFSDPLGRVRRGQGYMGLDNARMSLSSVEDGHPEDAS